MQKTITTCDKCHKDIPCRQMRIDNKYYDLCHDCEFAVKYNLVGGLPAWDYNYYWPVQTVPVPTLRRWNEPYYYWGGYITTTGRSWGQNF